MLNALVRILVVDDFEPFRGMVCSMLREYTEFQVIAEASDGLAALQQATDLQPDLILLDIGLPDLNGIEVARRILKRSPESKILFVSQETSVRVVQEALSTGAHGYVVKENVASDLLAALSAVLRGEQFVAGRLAGGDLPEITMNRTARASGGLAPVQSHGDLSRRHEVQFYSDDAYFLNGFSQFVGDALKAGNTVMVVATESHRDSLLLTLQARGVNVIGVIEQGRYIALDAAETLSTFMVNGLPNPVRFLKVAGDLILGAAKAANRQHARVSACGECAPLLWAQGKAEAAIQLERLWNEIATKYDIDILCGYSLNSFRSEQGSHVFQEICAEHSAVHVR